MHVTKYFYHAREKKGEEIKFTVRELTCSREEYDVEEEGT